MENTKPEVKITLFDMDDPTFEGGAVKTARANLSNPTAKQFTYEVELYLSTSATGISKAATSGVGTVTVPAGGTMTTNFTLTMPLVEAAYYVFVNIKVAGIPLVLHKATENVIISISPAINIDFIGWV